MAAAAAVILLVTTDQGPLLIAASGLPPCHLATLPPCHLAPHPQLISIWHLVAADWGSAGPWPRVFALVAPPRHLRPRGQVARAGPGPPLLQCGATFGRGAGAVPAASLQLLGAFYIFGFSFQKFVCSPPSLATLPQLPHPRKRVIPHSS